MVSDSSANSLPAWQAELDRIREHMEALDPVMLLAIANMPLPANAEDVTVEGIQISLARGVLRKRTGIVVVD